MQANTWHSFDAEEALHHLESSAEGLTTADAQHRLAKYGPNTIPEKRRRSLLMILLGQSGDFMIMVLLRDGKSITLAASELVPGDIVLLQAGNIVPADLRLLEVVEMQIDESALTGESIPVSKQSEVINRSDLSPGDRLNIAFKGSKPDSRFERHGADLWRLESIEIPDAVLGTKINIPTLDGQIEVKVPAGSQPDEILRLKGKGLPVFGAPMRGDINIRLQVHIPEKLTSEEKELYSQLRNKSKQTKKRWW